MNADPGDLRALATLGALASRIEPQLLRRLRLDLLPWTDAGVEAALWFSPDLVALRAPTGLVLAPAALRGLRDDLARFPEALEAAWAITAEMHAAAPAALRLEEELTYLALKGLDQPEVEARARELLRRALRTMVERGGGMPGWADRAVERMPPALLALEEARMVAHGAALRLGRSGPLLAVAAASVAGEDWSWLAPAALRRIPLSVAWVEGGLEFGPSGAREGHALDVPALLPLALHVWPDGPEAGPGQRVPVHPLRRSFVPVEASHVVIQVLGGRRLELRLRAPPGGSGVHDKVRKPRVHITYEVETEGAAIERELPFVVGVLGDFRGAAEDRPHPLERKFMQVDIDNLDDVVARMAPRLRLVVPPRGGAGDTGETPVELRFAALADFEPDRVARQVPGLAALLERRAALDEALSLCGQRTELRTALVRLLREPARDPQALVLAVDAALPHWDPVEQSKVQRALEAMRDSGEDARQDEPPQILQRGMAALDARLSAGLAPILRHPDFAALEGSWRGLAYLVRNSETGASLKIRVIDLTKAELAADMAEAGDDPRRSVLHRTVHDNEFGMPGGEPYGALVGDYAWDAGEPDVRTLQGVARVAAACLAPFLTAAAPALFGFAAWREVSRPPDLARILEAPGYAAWRALRDSEEAGYLTLTLPRVLARPPYGAQAVPFDAFAFEELPPGRAAPEPDDLCWTNAAYVMAGRMTEAFAQHGWCTAIRGAEGGGKVQNLPSFRLPTDDGGFDEVCPTEIGIADRREAELSQLGLLPLCHYRNTDYAVFFGAQTLRRPKRYDMPEAMANAAIAARLPFVMATGRFMQVLKVIARDKIGSFMEARDCQMWLHRWIQNYVNPTEGGGKEMRAKYPLREAQVQVVAERGEYRIIAHLRPWLQMEELTASLRLETSIPVTI